MKKKTRSLNPSGKKQELLFSVSLADCELQTFSAGGPGGQHQNTSNTAVRIIHRPSGASGEARDDRSQLRNKQAAFRRMAESAKFKAWIDIQVHEAGESPERQVEQSLRPENIKVEYFDGEQWNYTY